MTSSWRKIQKLGQGSYGSVDLATTLWCYAAVKSTTLEKSSSLERELEFLYKLQGNPYVVQCYGKDISQEEDGSTRYNVLMEYAPCGTLHDLIRNSRYIPETVVAYYSYLLLRGLSSLHRQGIIHCDIKPRNVLLFDRNEPIYFNVKTRLSETVFDIKHVKLADFGFSTYEWEEERETFCGTPLYGSPEAMIEGLHGKETDIWSLGMTVLEMLYRGEEMRDEGLTDVELMMETAYEGPPDIPPYVMEDCRNFVSKCLEMEVEERWSADELLTHDFITRNVEKIRMQNPGLGLGFDECDTAGPKTNPFGSWSNTEGLFSAPQKTAVAPQYQLFPDRGNESFFGGPNLIQNLVAI